MTDPTTHEAASSDRGPEVTDVTTTAPERQSAEDDQALAEAVARRRAERARHEAAQDEAMRAGRALRGLVDSPEYRAALARVAADPRAVDEQIAAVDREARAEIERTRRDRRYLAYANTRRHDYADADLGGLKPQQDPKRRVSHWWASGTRTLLLAGPSGHGKTHAAYAVANAVAEDDRCARADATVRAHSAVELADALRPLGEHARRDPEVSARQARIYDDARTCDLLVLDDLGREQVTDWWRERLFSILDARASDRRLRTIITLNAGSRDAVATLFAERYGSPVQSRVEQDAVAAWIEGEPMRKVSAWDPFA